ncbi:hypothetical protein J5N97_004209 [Dioscorea zingiberensis]|uniref:Uncharacterized protein n=1 Tax=Dioscorea zingiberensis TaxID=325984 RepID=A0A9D5D7Z0_9LILI|nr:hypothetical protein J5N97_004209 [Dioscorea zingiberensis]
MDSKKLHIFFVPFLSPGHMIPMVDMARLFAARSVTSTIVTTTANAALILPTITGVDLIHLLTVPFSSSQENLTAFPTPELTPSFIESINTLETPVKTLVQIHSPDFIISDVFFPWSANLGVPRISFHGSNFFSTILSITTGKLKLHETVSGDDELFLVPGLPHRIELTRRMLPELLQSNKEFIDEMGEANRRSFGMVVNSFYEIEPEYVDMFKGLGSKVWTVGSLSVWNEDTLDKHERGGKANVDVNKCLAWLDKKKPRSVLYVCFGSLGRFTKTQLEELAAGLHGSGHPFIWVVREEASSVEEHEEEQAMNEKLMVDVLKVGVSVGVKVCSLMKEERTLVKREEIRMAVEEVMGCGEEVEERRKKAEELGEMARRAVQEGGSSFQDMDSLMQVMLMEIKTSSAEVDGDVANKNK